MRILVVNAGSSSLKLRLLSPADEVLADHETPGWDGADPTPIIERFVADAGPADAVGHRVVHGGTDFDGPVVVDAGVAGRLATLAPLAPLHQPRCLAAIHAAAALLPATPAVACFDTAFHAALPAEAATYPLPAEWRARWPLRRFGFHGLSHAWAARRAAALLDAPPGAGLRLITCHLGAGSSLCAIRDGRSVDTTMGFTPLDGLVMATRSGALDPGLVLWLIEEGGLTAGEVARGLSERSGLAGLAGGDGDLRRVGAAAAAGDTGAGLAVDVWAHRLCREIAGMVAALGGLDALVFTGGIGEHQPGPRAAAAERLGFLGVAVDREANAVAVSDADIAAAGARCRTLVVTAREDLEIARQVRAALRPDRPAA